MIVLIGASLLIPFFYYGYKELQFFQSKEAKEETNTEGYRKASIYAFPLLPLGWFLLEMSHRFFTLSFDTYRDLIWILILISCIVYSFTLQHQRRKTTKNLS
ncbi:hypothetical protein JCM19047_4469 [Bacillus sp. JCM 19047]|uniref:DUF3784 domain-containing protein n=1 Tax=Shouchella miscanthi TaxID=2598861 RepID=A0ABU6NQW1_9BACI|nr:hypothetical protein [Shouchella miscanthi]MED4130589.1 hypothetical protein [Shouchella miscanthi]GAF24553.1 hypothetical protein JCM19047_4469 [Bacillus sp. JCM 19047]